MEWDEGEIEIKEGIEWRNEWAWNRSWIILVFNCSECMRYKVYGDSLSCIWKTSEWKEI